MHTRKTSLLDKENKRQSQSQSDYLKKYSIENEKTTQTKFYMRNIPSDICF